MKPAYNKTWKRSVQPRKQRKYAANAPAHIKGKFLSARLSKDLATKHETRSTRVRSGDKVKVMRGQFKGKEGEVERVNLRTSKLLVGGVEFSKNEAGKIKYPIHASNVMITSMKSDAKRLKDTKKATRKKE